MSVYVTRFRAISVSVSVVFVSVDRRLIAKIKQEKVIITAASAFAFKSYEYLFKGLSCSAKFKCKMFRVICLAPFSIRFYVYT